MTNTKPIDIIMLWIKANIKDISFEKFVNFLKDYNDKPCTSIQELKEKNNKKLVGDIFEVFVKLYIKFIMHFEDVWLLKELPDDIRNKLNLQKQDLGIDLIGYNDNGYHAIQAKFRSPNQHKKTGISWKELSTFYGLTAKTGPYKSHIVITNADYVRHIGKKEKYEKSLCKGTLTKLKWSDWILMINGVSNTNTYRSGLTSQNFVLTKPNLEELRQKRLIFFDTNI